MTCGLSLMTGTFVGLRSARKCCLQIGQVKALTAIQQSASAFFPATVASRRSSICLPISGI